MKKLFTFCITLALSLSLFMPVVSAQLLTNTESGLAPMTETVRSKANFSEISIQAIIASVIKIVLGFLGVVFIILIIIAGFKWMMAQGNEQQVTESLSTIRTAIIGLIIVLASYAITYFVFKYVPFSGSGGSLTGTM